MRISDWSSDVCSSDLVGTLDGHIVTAGKLALESGAKVAHVDDIASALTALRSGQGADMVMVEVNLDIATFCKSLKSERISVPVIACGIGPEPSAAANAIRAGRWEERREGKGGVRPCRHRWQPSK